MNLPALSSFTEITFGPAFHVEPLRGKSFPAVVRFSAVNQLTAVLSSGESEFDAHLLDFASFDYAAPYLSFKDAAGDLLFTFGPAE